MLSVVVQEFPGWCGELIGHSDWLPLKLTEIPFERCLRQGLPQLRAENHREPLVESHQTRVKCRVVKCRQAEAVAGVEAVIGEILPRPDVACHQQSRNIDAAHATAHAISIQNGLPEKLLTPSNLDRRHALRGETSECPRWCRHGGLAIEFQLVVRQSPGQVILRDMEKTYRIELGELDLGQLLDGLESRAEAWEKTAEYFRLDGMPDDEFFIIEECSGLDEAVAIAGHYRSIISKVRRQMDRSDQ